MLKSLNKGGVYTPIYLRLSGFSGNSAAQIKKLKKTAPTIQTMTNPSISKVSKKTAVLKSTPAEPGKKNKRKLKGIQKHQSKLVLSSTNAKQEGLTSGETDAQIFNLEQQIKPKSLPLHTVNLLIYQLNRKLKILSLANSNEANITKAYTKSKKKKKKAVQ